jgi:hypothetical protein
MAFHELDSSGINAALPYTPYYFLASVAADPSIGMQHQELGR